MLELIERLEAASVGSRELDCVIDCALFGGEPWPNSDRVHRKDGSGYGYTQAFAPYTTSLDAALALTERVLPGWEASLSQRKPRRDETCAEWWHASLFRLGTAVSFGTSGGTVSIKASTPALALVIATLKAVSAKAGEHG